MPIKTPSVRNAPGGMNKNPCFLRKIPGLIVVTVAAEVEERRAGGPAFETFLGRFPVGREMAVLAAFR